MEKLFDIIEDGIQEQGFQCIRMKDFEDFCKKLDCMGGSYKGFIMYDSLDDFCLMYVDTEKMRKKAYERSVSMQKGLNICMSRSDIEFINAVPERYVYNMIKGRMKDFYLMDYDDEKKKSKKKHFLQFYENILGCLGCKKQ